MALYEQYPEGAAALTGLTYAFMYCREPAAEDRSRCRKVMPRAKKIALKHHAQDPEIRSLIFSVDDLEFLDQLYARSAPRSTGLPWRSTAASSG